MSYRNVRTLAALVASVVVVCQTVAVSAAAAEHSGLPDGTIAHQLIFRLVPNGNASHVSGEAGGSSIESIPGHNIFLMQLPPHINENAMLALLNAHDDVAWASFNFSLGVSDGSTQSFFLNADVQDFLLQEAFNLLELDIVHGHAMAAGTVVAVLDTGIDPTHELLAGRIIEGGYNFIDMNEDVTESAEGEPNEGAVFGHGTFVAGLIAHIAPGASILPIKVLDEHGQGDTFHAAAAILHAIDHGADVINLSLGTTVSSMILDYAVEQAHEAGVTIVSAAGNKNQSEPVEFPAAHPLAIAVASTELNDVKAAFSNYGEHINLVAPGTDIVSSFPGNLYARTSGTSVSTAIISAAVAVLYAELAAAEQVRDALLGAAINIDDVNVDYAGLLGAGRMRLREALQITVPAPGEFHHDGSVKIDALLILLGNWGDRTDPADCPGDRNVGIDDLLILLGTW